MICLTLDQDWAPRWATLRAFEEIRDAGLCATVFVTHACPSLSVLRQAECVELAIHPNFLPGSTQGDTPEEILENLLDIVPEAVGVRTHGLVRATRLLEMYGRWGLRYDASDLLEGHPHLRPVTAWNGVARLPIYWEDDVHLLHGRKCELKSMSLEAPGIKCLSFHPMLIALNASDLDGYRSLLEKLGEKSRSLSETAETEVAEYVQEDGRGISDLFADVVEYLRHASNEKIGFVKEAVERG